MENKKDNIEWRDAWPESPEATLLFQTVAHFRRLEIERELEAFPYDEYDVKASPDLAKSITAMLNKARRKAVWNKRKATLRKAAAVAAIVIMCLFATPTVMFAVSAEFRETVYNYIIDWRQGHADVNIDAALPAEPTFPRYYVPTFIPEGLVLKNYIDDELKLEQYYSDGEQYFYFATRNVLSGATMDTESATYYFDYRINGLPAIIMDNQGEITILWQDDVTSFTLETNLPLDTALKIAASYEVVENFL